MRTVVLPCLLLCIALSPRAQVNIVTQHINNQRTGWNDRETSLNTKNVKPGSFGKLFTLPLDDKMFAEPLVCRLDIPGTGVRNVLIAVTVNNTVYAYDADSVRSAGPFWQTNLTPAGTRPPKNTDMTGACGGNYMDFIGNIGIVGTPVIDTLTNTLYLVSRSVTTDGTNVFAQYLHALDLTTGAERTNSPVTIGAQVSGSGAGSSGGVLPFNPQKQNQRPGLLLLNGIVYIGYASHCDWNPYHGWLFGYDAATLQQKIVYNTTPDGSEGGVWLGGSGPAADAQGYIYVTTGNGTTGVGSDPTNNRNRGESMIKLTPSGNTLSVADYFVPYNYNTLNNNDLDFGGGEVLLLPGMNRVLAGCKDGNLYLADANNLGQFQDTGNHIIQTIPLGTNAHLRSSFGCYHGTAGEYVYTMPENTALKALPVNRGAGNIDIAHTVVSGIQGPIGNNGANISTSSNGAVDSTAIVWITHAYNCDANHQTCPGIVRAINAGDVTQELWNSSMLPTDSIGLYAKFSAPTVANSKLYVATFGNQLVVYGLTQAAADTCVTPNLALGRTAVSSSNLSSSVAAANAVDGKMTTQWTSKAGNTGWIYVDLGEKFELCRVALYWGAAYGSDFDIQVSNDASAWTTVSSVRGNNSAMNFLSLQGAGRYVRMNGINAATANGYSLYEMQVFGASTVACSAPGDLQATYIEKNSTTLTWGAVTGASSYSVQYKSVSSSGWTTATSSNANLLVTALSCGTDYIFQVATKCPGGTFSEYSPPIGFSTLSCSAACSPLPTRWSQSDIGSVGVAGQDCFDGNTFTLQGSGADIGGTVDAFRFGYLTLTGDDQFITRIVTQDKANADNKTGIMIRSTSDANSPNAFVGVTSGTGAFFQTRSTIGGNTASVTATGIAAPYWLKLVKAGTTYAGYTSPDGLSWTQLGTTQDLGFGAGTTATLAGLAVTSHKNTALSTTTADNFTQSSALPVTLVSFTGQVSGQTVVLRWTTAQEENSSRFEVERSTDGVHFTMLTAVPAAGNSNSSISYSAEDAMPLDGVDYYRLRLVDLDGRFTYSPVVLIHYGNATAPLLFPNPAHSYFTVMAGDRPLTAIKVYDLAGRLLVALQSDLAGPTLTIPCSRLSPGLYIVEMHTSNGRYVQKLMKN